MPVPARRRAAPLATILPAILAGAALHTAVAAQQSRYAIDSCDVVVAVQPDGSYRVSERMAYVFARRYAWDERVIPLRYVGSWALDSVRGVGVSITGVRARVAAGALRVRWTFPSSSGRLGFVLHYTVRGALFQKAGRNIVDWDAVTRDWRVPMGDVQATVLLPGSWPMAAGEIHAQPPGARVARTPEGWRVDFSYRALPRRTAYRVVVDFPAQLPGRNDWPGLAERPAGAVPAVAPLPRSYAWLLPLALLAGLLPGVFLFLSWRSPRREMVSAGASPTTLERAAMMLPEWNGAQMRLFAAVIFDLAARGHLALGTAQTRKGVFSQLHVQALVRDDSADPLTPFERGLLDELRRHPTLTDFGSRGRRYRRDAVRALRWQLQAEGLLEDHTGRSRALALLAVACGAAAVAGLILSGVRLLPAVALLAGAMSGLLFPAALVRTVTESGALLRAQVLANLAWLRQRIEEMARTSPIEAVQAYMHALPWLALDTRATPFWLQRIARGLRNADGQLTLPAWAVGAMGAADATAGEAAALTPLAAFLPFMSMAAAVSASAAPASGAGGRRG